jgi:hypothetical protein
LTETTNGKPHAIDYFSAIKIENLIIPRVNKSGDLNNPEDESTKPAM